MSISASDLMSAVPSNHGRADRITIQSWRDEQLTYRSPELQSINIGVSRDYTPSTDEVSPPERDIMTILKELVLNSLRELGAQVLDVKPHYSEGVGLYMLATLDCSARQALEYWLKIVDEVKAYEIPIFIMWTGKIDVAPEEMGAYIGKALARMNVFLATREPLDIVKILREE